MIKESEVQRIGTIVKPHGVGGEMAVTVPASLSWTDDLDCLVCSMDGILVPFYVESIREKSGTVILVKFEGYDTVESTSRFMGVTVYMPLEYVAESADDDLEWGCFLDWKVVDAAAGPLGTIHAVDDSTPNILFLVKDGGRERIIPANEEWITAVDRKNRTLKYKLPEGLADL
ncbi:MAG: 16S rRNA processing protein RimM [Bacteroidaceae bacterium]|jgi:16S rRNA processing protein RimM|nr:16S rRNA processing protein RimM [Bacteroidaceae bacterium]